MQELVKNGKTEEYWKEATIKLPANEEFTYIVQNKNTNCIFIRNHSNANITAGAKPCSHEVFVAPNNTGVLSRPFPLKYAYLTADKPATINLVETVSQNPVDNIVQQEIVHKINVVGGVNLDVNKNVGVFVHNTPLKVCQLDAFKPLHVSRSIAGSNTVVLDTGVYGRPIVNIYVRSNGGSANFSVKVSFDNHEWVERILLSTPTNGGSVFTSFNDNAFRYILVGTGTPHSNLIIISAIR